MLKEKAMDNLVAGLVALMLAFLPGTVSPAAQASEPVKGFVLVSSTTANPTIIKASQRGCTTATVQVFAQRGTFKIDNPTVTVSLAKASSDPANLEVDITPASRRATITESTRNFKFKVCAQREKAMTGKVTLKSSITNWGPPEKFDRKSEELNYEVAPITVEN